MSIELNSVCTDVRTANLHVPQHASPLQGAACVCAA